MVCNNCGTECQDTDKFCGSCGHKIVSLSENLKSEEMEKAKIFSDSIFKYSSNNKTTLNTDFEQDNGNYKSSYREMNKRRKIPVWVTVILIVLLLSFGLFIYNSNKAYSNKGKRTIMIYMIGSDLESKYLAASKDIDEMINASIDFDDVNILIYTGGSKKWHKSEIPADKQALFEVNSNGLVKIEEFDATRDMLESENLTFLLEYGYKNYDTEYYDLILWDHGAGPVYGYGYDEYNKLSSMSLSELKEALYNSPFNGGNKLELVGFDACLMSSIEVASLMADYSMYMVASQEFEPGSGWNYGFLKDVDSKTSSEDFGRAIVKSFKDYYAPKKNVTGISLSLIKLSKVEKVVSYLDTLFEQVDDDLTIDFSQISRSRSNSKSFGRISNEVYHYDLVDLMDLISKLPEKYTKEVSDLKFSINEMVVYQETDLENTNGVSIYFPYENKKEIVSNMQIYGELDFAPAYYNFISNFSSKLTGKRISDWNITNSRMVSSGGGEVAIILPEEVLIDYSSADYIIFERDEDGYFTPIINGTDVFSDGTTFRTKISKKNLTVTSGNDKMSLTAIEHQKGIDFVSYYIPATLTKWDENLFDFEMIAVYLEFVVDQDHPDGFISNVYPIDVNENYTYSKIEIDINDWDTLSLVSTKYKILDANGKYITNWENSNEITRLDISPSEEFEIKCEDLDISNKYYCIFRVKDSQDNTYLSNIKEVNNK